MLRGLLALAFVAIALPAPAAETCGPTSRIDASPVYVIMHGYHRPMPALGPLSMIDVDLGNMSHSFRSLGPERAFVQGVNSEQGSPPGDMAGADGQRRGCYR